MKIITADYVLPISSEPIRDGAVVFENGVILGVGTCNLVKQKFPEAAVEHFGPAAILPGFVNCHSHLEITGLRGALDDVEHDFRSWLLKLHGLRAAMSTDEIKAFARGGAFEGARAGVTCFGDIGRIAPAGIEALHSVGLRGIVFQETEFSPDNRTADDDFSKLAEKYHQIREMATELVEVGISPHSPYTVSRLLFEKIGRFALDENIRLTIHAAESDAETGLMLNGDGFFAEIYAKFGAQWQSPKCSSITFLEQTGILEPKPLLAHCVAVTDADIEIIAKTGAGVAHCPKSNAKFGHGSAPLEKFLAAGLPVGLGSDSVASNNACDILEESRFAILTARNRPDRNRFLSARETLQAATLGGAKALGLSHKIGTLEPGKQADITVISLDHHAQQPVNDIEAALVFSSNGRDVLATIVAGREVYRRDSENLGSLKRTAAGRVQDATPRA